MLDFLSYAFVQNALLAALFSGIACGIVGSYVVVRRMVALSGGITHSSFGGIGIAYWAGLSPTAGALLFGVASAFAIEALGYSKRMRSDTAIGILWSAGMAIGILFIFLTPGYAPNLMGFLFGNLLLVERSYVILLAVWALILILLFVKGHRLIGAVALDEGYAASQGLPVRTIHLAMIGVVAATIVWNIQATGIVLLVSMLTLPTAVANIWTNSFPKLLVWSAVVGAMGAMAGVVGSYIWDLPSSALTVGLLAAAFGASKLLKRIYGR